MTSYYEFSVTVSEGQREKIKHALQNDQAVNIRLDNSDLIGSDILLLTKAQINKIDTALKKGTGVTLKLSKTQVKKNVQFKGGFLGMLAGLAARALPIVAKTVLPALGIGALTGAANSLTQKAMGSGLYLKRGGCCAKIETDGKGLYLSPTKNIEKYGDGLYLSQNGKMYNGKGLLLGANSPFKHIPLLNLLL